MTGDPATAATPEDELSSARRLRRTVLQTLGRSLHVRHLDAGSCNGCEIEVAAAFGPVYDAERYGARLVASPRHADALLVTGVVTHNMAAPLRRWHHPPRHRRRSMPRRARSKRWVRRPC